MTTTIKKYDKNLRVSDDICLRFPECNISLFNIKFMFGSLTFYLRETATPLNVFENYTSICAFNSKRIFSFYIIYVYFFIFVFLQLKIFHILNFMQQNYAIKANLL